MIIGLDNNLYLFGTKPLTQPMMILIYHIQRKHLSKK